jgi:CopG family nickel-responsive transcriptional regulator
LGGPVTRTQPPKETVLGELVRFGVSIESELLDQFDRHIVGPAYSSRSEAIRDLVRSRLVELEWQTDSAETVATLTLVYDHDVREIEHKLNEFQHAHIDCVLASTHVHIEAHTCLEVVILRGPARTLRAFADTIIGLTGVRHGKLTMTTTAKSFPHARRHAKRHDHAPRK